jgi:alkylation response protein AidB-like acyl-CoA dehydrogenase
MHFEWTPQVEQLIDGARQFAERKLTLSRPVVGFDRAAWNQCGTEGVIAGPLPEAWGGRAHDALTTVALFNALGGGGADRGLLFALGAHLFGCSMAIARFGSLEQHERWGTGLADGTVVAALAATEPSGGSSASRMTTLARPTHDGYIISGAKTLVTNGPVADLFLLIASEAPNRGALGLTAFLVPRDTRGLEVEPLVGTLGMQGAPMARIVFNDCVLAKEAVLSKPCGGLAVFTSSMQYERSCILAGFLGAAERDLAACVAYTQGRRDAGGRLFDHQAVSHRLARMKCRIESARWLLYWGAWSIDQGKDPLSTPAMVKLSVSEALVDCAMDVLRTFAGAAWLDEQGMATALRDVVGTLSASGTSDVQLNLIASGLRDHRRTTQRRLKACATVTKQDELR